MIGVYTEDKHRDGEWDDCSELPESVEGGREDGDEGDPGVDDDVADTHGNSGDYDCDSEDGTDDGCTPDDGVGLSALGFV